MNENHIWKLSTQQVAIFLKAMEYRNFRKAAEFYHYTPSTVSKTIAALEEELGITLFDRGPNELVPTAAALQLAEDWRLLLGSINNSILRARNLERGDQRKLAIGIVDSAEYVDEAVREVVLRFREKHPDIEVVVEKHDMHRLVELLNVGMLDIVYSSAMEISYLAEHFLPWERVKKTHVAAFVPRSNQLYERDSIDWTDLMTEELVGLDPLMHPGYSKWLTELCGAHGFIPILTSTYRTVRSLKYSLSMNDRIFIGETITEEWGTGEMRSFVFPDESFTLLAWRQKQKPEFEEIREALREALLRV
ncbi:MAG: LysR family transcriptional regulator [Mogibacterium sp.]|nr:LysR family transcriptional regulator [Mogibacterium sp.]